MYQVQVIKYRIKNEMKHQKIQIQQWNRRQTNQVRLMASTKDILAKLYYFELFHYLSQVNISFLFYKNF